jgi:uncharacterized protein (AIM24 family)
MQYVEIELDPPSQAEAGSFMMMDNNIQMETIFEMVQEQKSGIFANF